MTTLSVEINEKHYATPSSGDRLKETPQVLENVRFSCAEREFVCMVGPSGSGKTTCLNIIAGLDPDFTGSVSVQAAEGDREPRVGYVFQTMRLLPWRTVLENVELPLSAAERATGIARQILAEIGLGDILDAYPERLSVGMQRRVAIARAFAIKPDILLMDEPFVSLDDAISQRLRDQLLSLWRAHPTTVIFVTHDLREAFSLADRILQLGGSPATLSLEQAIAVARQDRSAEWVEQMRTEWMTQAN